MSSGWNVLTPSLRITCCRNTRSVFQGSHRNIREFPKSQKKMQLPLLFETSTQRLAETTVDRDYLTATDSEELFQWTTPSIQKHFWLIEYGSKLFAKKLKTFHAICPSTTSGSAWLVWVESTQHRSKVTPCHLQKLFQRIMQEKTCKMFWKQVQFSQKIIMKEEPIILAKLHKAWKWISVRLNQSDQDSTKRTVSTNIARNDVFRIRYNLTIFARKFEKCHLSGFPEASNNEAFVITLGGPIKSAHFEKYRVHELGKKKDMSVFLNLSSYILQKKNWNQTFPITPYSSKSPVKHYSN